MKAEKVIKHTKKQLKNWERYEAVRQSGNWNMWFPEARMATGLSKEDYLYNIKHYDTLKEQAGAGSL